MFTPISSPVWPADTTPKPQRQPPQISGLARLAVSGLVGALSFALASTNALAQAHSTASGAAVAATPSVPAKAMLSDHPNPAPADEGQRRPGAPGRPDNTAPSSTDDNRDTALLGAALTALVWLHRRNRKGPGQG